MSYRVEQERETHARRLETLARRLEKLKKDVIDTEIQLENEQLIGEELALKTRRTGLLAFMDGSDDEAETSEDEVEVSGELSDVTAQVEATTREWARGLSDEDLLRELDQARRGEEEEQNKPKSPVTTA